MDFKTMYLAKIKFFLALFVLISQLSFGQLTNFSLTVTKTDETCTGNGTLTFSTSGTTSGATLLYSVYLLPNITTPLVTLSSNTITGLTSGNYRVVALESLGSLSNTQQQDVFITNLITPLSYQITGQSVSCVNNGVITVNVVQGNPVTYELISGPIIRTPQASNVFSGLVIGQYDIRVNDACGDALVQTFTILQVASQPTFTIDAFNVKCKLIDCNTATIGFTLNNIPSIGVISYPLAVSVIVYNPSGGTLVFNQTLNSGGIASQSVSQNIPFYYGINYNCNITVTDSCGNVVSSNNHQISGILSIGLEEAGQQSCFKEIVISSCYYVLPITVTFLSAPAGFNPNLYNSNNLGPFNSLPIIYTATAANDIPNGDYLIKITDACGRTAQDLITIIPINTDYIVLPVEDVCSHNSTINIPYLGVPIVSVVITVAPTGFNHPLPYDASTDIINGEFQMTLIPGTYTFTGFDICGRPFNFNFIVLPSHIPNLELTGGNTVGCLTNTGTIFVHYTSNPLPDNSLYSIGGPFLISAIITNAPTAFNYPLPFDISTQIVTSVGLDPSLTFPNGFSSAINLTGLPIGDYTIHFVDNCGNVYDQTVNVPLILSNVIIINTLKGCDEGQGSVLLNGANGLFQTVTITAAPTSYTGTLPQDVSFNITPNGFYLNFLPEGTYTFHTIDVCGVQVDTVVNIIGYHVLSNTIDIQGNCGSFNIVLQHVVNENFGHEYWLQKLDTVTNQWGNPYTGVAYANGTIPNNNNSYSLTNMATNYNIAATGTFRILKYHKVYGSNGVWTNCFQTIKDFDFTGELKIISATTLPCPLTGSQVILNVTGIAPFTFKITTRNGMPFLVNNGSSNIFSGLSAAIYNFQVQDLCGNIVNRLFDIATLPVPAITPSNLCDGQNGQLSVQAFSYLSYQWWKGTATTTILSTTNVLGFNPFSNSLSPGIYYVRLYSQTSLACIDETISYTVPSSIVPHAGLDSQISVCGSVSTINLSTLLSGTFDTGGVWTEITNSGMLSGSSWLPVGVAYGVYVFKYKVDGFCNDFDEAIITINFNGIPPTPIITVNQSVCSGDSIQFNVNTIPNATYQWTGPNGFTSNNQNPLITNCTINNVGQYLVRAIIGGCESSASVNINLNPSPNFEINSACTNGVQTLLVVPFQNSFDPNNVNYSWTGPQNFTSSSNPITITGSNFGTYNVAVTNTDFCTITKSIEVSNLCSIPNVVTPNNNQNSDFDLTGLNVLNLEIYSRWGRLVYNKENYINQWHGQNNTDGLLPDGTYFYLIKLNNGEDKTGWVYLVK
jgi:gliding motility-associated-like protein